MRQNIFDEDSELRSRALEDKYFKQALSGCPVTLSNTKYFQE